MDLTRIIIFVHLALQLPLNSLASSASRQSRLRGAAASTWRREIQAIASYNGHSTGEEFMTLCQIELGTNGENGIVSHDDYAVFLRRYCQSNPAWACTRDTSYFWRLDPRLQRVFISERCPGDDFHQEECLSYFVGHPEQDFGYSGDLGKLCSAVKQLLVPTGLVWEMTDVSDGDAQAQGPTKSDALNVDGSNTRSQELQTSSKPQGEQLGRNGKSKGSAKRAKNNDDAPLSRDDEEERNEKGKTGEREENAGEKGEGEDQEEERENEGEQVAVEEDDGGGVSEGDDKEVVDSTNADVEKEKDEATSTTSTNEAEVGDQNQDLSPNVDDSEGSPQNETLASTTDDSSTEDDPESNKDDKEPRKDQKNELNEGSQNADSNIINTNGESNNGSSPAGSHRPEAAEDMLGSQGDSDEESTNKREEEKVKNYVIAIVGSVAFVLLLGIAHRTRTSLNTRSASASPKHHANLEACQDLSLSSGESYIFDASGDSTLEAALSFIDRNTSKEQSPTARQKSRIASFFTRLVLPARVDETKNTASDSDSVLARCEDLSIESDDELMIFSDQTQRKNLLSGRRGRCNQPTVGSISRMKREQKFLDVGHTVDRILKQIEESPCESELSEEDLSISECTDSSCDDIDNNEVRERFREFESRLTAEFEELNAQMLDPTNQSPPPIGGCATSDASSFRSIIDGFETRAGYEFVYRGGAGSSGPDSSTTSDAESSCSSTNSSE